MNKDRRFKQGLKVMLLTLPLSIERNKLIDNLQKESMDAEEYQRIIDSEVFNFKDNRVCATLLAYAEYLGY